MTDGRIEVIGSAVDLRDEWDAAAGGNLFLKKRALLVLEDVNPCGQLYHIASGAGPSSIAVTYRHRLNLLTYGVGSFSIPVTIVGIPCSVSSSGFSMSAGTKDCLIDHLRGLRGTKVVLNAENGSLAGFVQGSTLPTCRLDVKWASFEEYLSSMRSHYRYKLGKARSAWSQVSVSTVDNDSFGEDLHELYLSVFKRSRYKLEKLGIGFFRKFPSVIEQFKVGDRPIGFLQTVCSGGELIFMFAGMDYEVSQEYETYINILLHVIRKGIEAGCSSIDLGQTSEETKCRLGCRLVTKGLCAAHSSRTGHLALSAMARALSYRHKEHEYRVFK
ncbi:MAG: GNAT family N-acetyltransferase [Kiritimatiellia bacterium]|jgi:hypothetical protein|nr:GNAT family N-acetyltransferase [Kiritimatiellia bacterium]MDP6848362.1 GNAT family N-acetyltransferase [Kiritimatiellia bacterium]